MTRASKNHDHVVPFVSAIRHLEGDVLRSRIIGRALAVAAGLLVTGALTSAPTVATAATPATQPAYAPIQAENYSSQYGTGTRTAPLATVPPTVYVGYITNGDWTGYNDVDFGNGLQTWTVKYASPFPVGTPVGWIELHLDGVNTPPFVSMQVIGTGSWYNFITAPGHLLTPITGVHQVELRYVTSAGEDFMNIDQFQFSSS